MDGQGGILHNAVLPPVEGVAGGGTGYGWSDGVQDSNPSQGCVDVSKLPSTELLHVWCMPNTANVGQQEMPRPLEHISLLAARNERESIQIALRPKVTWGSFGIAGTVQVHCTDLLTYSGDRLVVGRSLSLRRTVPILGVPDALVPLDLPVTQINLLPGETTSLWFSVDIPAGQPPGQYEGQLSFTAVNTDTDDYHTSVAKADKCQLYKELKKCLDIMDPLGEKLSEEVAEKVEYAKSTLKRVLLSPTFNDVHQDNDTDDMMVEGSLANVSVNLKISVIVWDFTLPITPSLPAVFGISETVIEDRFRLEHGSEGWYAALDKHFKWLLQYRISPYFCKWGDGMRVLTYTCPWPADNSKSDEYYSDPRLSAYAVPYTPILPGNEPSRDSLKKEIEILKSRDHWKKAYFYLWDEPLKLEQYDLIRSISSEIRTYAPDARVLTTYHCGPSDVNLASSTFEAFLKVPNLLRPHTQIFCTSELVFGTREDLVKDVVSELQPENAEEWWTYICLGPSDPQPNWHLGMRGTQHRAVMWRVWKEGGSGFLYWGANCYEKSTVPSGEIRFRRGLPPGDGVLFYPGEVFSSSHEPVASVRLERILSGLQDFEYLKLYSSRHGRQEGLALLEKTGVYFGPEHYTLEHMPIDLMRGEIYRTCKS